MNYPVEHMLPSGIRARKVPGINGLTMHVLEAGFETPGRPLVLLLHGFPELAYSWRKVMPPLAAAGFHVIAPDQRGYGSTTGWNADYDGELRAFHMLSLARDALALVAAFGYRELAAVVGHDFGSPLAAWCALTRPDVFRSVVMMSAPFAGPPTLPFGTVDDLREDRSSPRSPDDPGSPRPMPASPIAVTRPGVDIHADLAALDPPRKHYQWYYATREANENMWHCPQGVHDFLRAYYHCKSADWAGNRPAPLASWSAAELAKLPAYYVMERDQGMAETVAAAMPSPAAVAGCEWLTEDELRVYSSIFQRTGFQGGLQWYRSAIDEALNAELQLFSGRTIDVPSCFIAGASDWGVRQKPGALEAMQHDACTRMLGCHLVAGAGHWVQQEQPGHTASLLLEFLAKAETSSFRTN
jgi:pimeloyl-ACP methyl ester carboxylesterase